MVALTSFSNMSDVERSVSSKRFWELYKNDPRFAYYVKKSIEGTDLEKRYARFLDNKAGDLSPPPSIDSNLEAIISDYTGTKSMQESLPLPIEEISTKTTPPGEPTWSGDFGEISATASIDIADDLTKSGDGVSSTYLHEALDDYELHKIETEVLDFALSYNRLSGEAKESLKVLAPQKHRLEISPAFTTFSPSGGYVRTPMPGLGLTKRRLMAYEETVSQIRSGDTLNFPATKKIPEKEFTVGKFLGAGNATHIYEISKGGTEPNTILRIPSSADFISHNPKQIIDSRVLSSDGSLIDHRSPDLQKYYPLDQPIHKRSQNIYDKDYTSYRLSWQYVNKRSKSICKDQFSNILAKPCYYTVKIISHDPNYRWVEVEKIHITESYENFYQNNFQAIQLVKQNKSNEEILALFPGIEIDRINKIREKTLRLESVTSLAKSSGASDFREAQLAWAQRPDTGEMDWILLDW